MVTSLFVATPGFSFADTTTLAASAAPPSITHQPIGSATYARNASMRIYLNASSPDGGYLTYQWFKSDLIPDADAKDGTTLTQAEMNAIKGNHASLEITGADHATFSGTSGNAPGYYYYWVVATNHLDIDGDGDTDLPDESAEVTSGFQLVKVVDRELPDHVINGDFTYWAGYPAGSDANGPYPAKAAATINPNGVLAQAPVDWYGNYNWTKTPQAQAFMTHPANTDPQAGWYSTHRYTGMSLAVYASSLGTAWSTYRSTQVPSPGYGRTPVAGEPWPYPVFELWTGYDGSSYKTPTMELGNVAPSAIYQDIATVPGKIYEWSFSHYGTRNKGTQKVAVVIGSSINTSSDYPAGANRWEKNSAGNPISTSATDSLTGNTEMAYQQGYAYTDGDFRYGSSETSYFDDVVNKLATEKAGGNRANLAVGAYTTSYNGSTYYIYISLTNQEAWANNAGVYTVPAGQGTTVFGFAAIAPLGSNAGNGLAKIDFHSGSPLTADNDMSYTGASSLSVDTTAGYAYALAEVRGSTPINLIGLHAAYTPAGAGTPSTATATSGLGTSDWYAGYTSYNMTAGTGIGTGFATGGKLTFTGLTPGKTYRIIGIPIGAISSGLGTNLSASEVHDDGYYDDVLLTPVYEGEDGIRPANVKIELYDNSGSDALRVIVEHADARVEYALLDADGINPNTFADPISVAATWTAGTGTNLNFDDLDPTKIYYLTARPRGQNEVSYAESASRFALKIGSQSQNEIDIQIAEVSRQTGTPTDTIKVANTDSSHTYYAIDTATNTYVAPVTGFTGGSEISFTGLDSAKTYQIVKKKTNDASLIMLKGVRVYPYAAPLYIDYVDEKIENTDTVGIVPANTEYVINAEANGAGNWLAGDGSVDTWLRGTGTSGVDLTAQATGSSTTSILDSIAQGTSGEMTYRVIAGADGYSGASVSPESTLAIPSRPTAPTPTVLSPLGPMIDYKIDYKTEKLVAGSKDIEVSERNVNTWIDIAASYTEDFATLDWDGVSDEHIDVRFEAVESTPDITASTSSGSFASFAAADTIVARPAAPTSLSAAYDSTNNKLTISGFLPATEYQASQGIWGVVPNPAQWSYDADDPAAIDVEIRLAATDTAPFSRTATFGASILLSPVVMSDLNYGYGVGDITSYPIEITNITGTDVTGAELSISGSDFGITPVSTTNITVPGNNTNTDYAIKPVLGLEAGVYTATLTVSYNVTGGTKTATAEVVLKVNKVNWDIDAMAGTVSGTADSLRLDMEDAPVGAKLDYRIGMADWIPSSAAVSSGGTDSHVYSDLLNGSANPLSPQSIYNLSVRAAADDNHYESAVYHTTGYTAYATPVWSDVLSINYRTEVISFNAGYDPAEYIVMIDTDELHDQDSLTSYANGTGTFDISVYHREGLAPTPYPASDAVSNRIDCRGLAPLLSDVITTPASSPYASDGVIEYLVGNIGGVGGTLTSFGYRAHRDNDTPDGYQIAAGTAHVSPERYDVRIPATATTFGSHPLAITVAGSSLSVTLHTKTADNSTGDVLPANISGIARTSGWNPVTGMDGCYDHDYLLEYTPLTLPADVLSQDYIFCGWYDAAPTGGSFSGTLASATPNESVGSGNTIQSHEYWAKWAIKPALDTIHSESLTGLSTNRTGLTPTTAITGSVTLPATVTSVGSSDVTASDDGAILVYTDDTFYTSGPVTFSPGNTKHVYVRVASTEDPAAFAYYDIEVTVLPANAVAPTISSHPASDSYYTDESSATPLAVSFSDDGTGTLAYQWYENTLNSTAGATAITGETNATYTPDITAPGTTYYYVIVTATQTGATLPTATVTSTAAEIVVQTRPVADLSLGSSTRTNAITATIDFTTTQPGTAYYLEKSGSAPTSADVVSANQPLGSVAAGTVSGQTIALPGEGAKTVYVVVVNSAGNSNALAIPVAKFDNTAPTITAITPNGTGVNVSGTITVTFSEAMDSSAGTLTFASGTGSIDGYASANWTNSTTYTVSYSGLANSTLYEVVFTGFKDAADNTLNSGSARQFTTIAANAQTPNITAHPIAANYLTTDSSPTDLSVTANVTDGGSLTYHWYYNTTDSAAVSGAVSAGTNQTLAPEITTAPSTRYYFCVVTNTLPNASDASVKVATATSQTAKVVVALPKYTVNFDIGSGTGTVPAQIQADIGTSAALPNGTGFSRATYTFGGWSKTSAPTPAQTDYPVGSPYTSTTETTVTLHAVWVQNVALLFNSEGGSAVAPVHIDPANLTYGDVNGWPTSPALDPTRGGYTFAGWYLEEVDGGTVVPLVLVTGTSLIASAGASQSITLHAHWTLDVDKTALGTELSSTAPKLPNIHEENYVGSNYQAFVTAYNNAKAVYDDPNVTQAQVDAALTALQNAYGALAHDHPTLKHSHDTNFGGVNHLTQFGDTVIIEIKGDIRDVVSFRLNGTDYPLTSGGVNVYNITESGNVIGTITEGSAVVTFPVAFADRFANGTHTLEVLFTDATGTATGKADLVVDRLSGSGPNNGSDPDKGPVILPITGDTIPVALILAAPICLLCGLLLLILACRRNGKKKRA